MHETTDIYFAGTNCIVNIYIDDRIIPVRHILGIQWDNQGDKAPLFGYNSSYWDNVDHGVSYIRGAMVVAFVTPDYPFDVAGISLPRSLQPKTYKELEHEVSNLLRKRYWKTDRNVGLYDVKALSEKKISIHVNVGSHDEGGIFQPKYLYILEDVTISSIGITSAQDDQVLARRIGFLARRVRSYDASPLFRHELEYRFEKPRQYSMPPAKIEEPPQPQEEVYLNIAVRYIVHRTNRRSYFHTNYDMTNVSASRVQKFIQSLRRKFGSDTIDSSSSSDEDFLNAIGITRDRVGITKVVVVVFKSSDQSTWQYISRMTPEQCERYISGNPDPTFRISSELSFEIIASRRITTEFDY